MNKLVWIASLTAAVALGTPAHAVNLIVNGDFSTPYYVGGWGENPVPGWANLSDSGVEVGDSSIYGLGCISSNCQNLEVNANTFGTVVQTVTGLTIDDSYNLTWYYGGRPGGGPQLLDVSFNGAPVATDSGSYGSWTRNWVEITATSTSEILQFASVNVGGLPSYGNEVTNVALTAVPEPATWAMMMVGFGGLGLLSFARRRRAVVAA